MKKLLLLIILTFYLQFNYAQAGYTSQTDSLAVTKVIAQYQDARETKDTGLLKSILTEDIDQLVSTGEWRKGLRVALDGMMKSSASRPGERTLTVDQLRLFDKNTALVDCRYEIKNSDGTIRRMWSSFVLLKHGGAWKIAAIRNMMPAK